MPVAVALYMLASAAPHMSCSDDYQRTVEQVVDKVPMPQVVDPIVETACYSSEHAQQRTVEHWLRTCPCHSGVSGLLSTLLSRLVSSKSYCTADSGRGNSVNDSSTFDEHQINAAAVNVEDFSGIFDETEPNEKGNVPSGGTGYGVRGMGYGV